MQQNHPQSQNFPQFMLTGYMTETAQQIGSGNYAKIFRVKCTKSIQFPEVAIKQIDMGKLRKQNQLHTLVEEIELMKKLRSEEVVQYVQSCVGANYSYIVMELCEGDLRGCIKPGKANLMPEAKCVNIFADIVKGLRVFVQNSYIHRDLKPENILVKNDKYKIGDLGFAVKADLNCQQKLNDVCGTPIYMAPELLNNEPYTAKCDIWSLGLILYEMIYGCTPWPVKCLDNYRATLKKRPLAFPFDIRIGKETKDFLKKSIVVDEEQRMSWKQLFQHPLVKNRMPGQVTIPQQITPKVRKIFSTVQLQAKRKQIDILKIFSEYDELPTLTYPQFHQLLSSLNPTISTYQIKLLFEACDKNSNNEIDKNQFKAMFCEVNYDSHHEAQKEIDQIFGIICGKGLDLRELFQRFDQGQLGALGYQEFCALIREIAPGYGRDCMEIVFHRIDENKDGLITKKEFVKAIGGGLVTQKHYIGLWLQKTTRNITTLKSHLSQQKLTSKSAIKLVDLNHDDQLDIKQFGNLMQIIQFAISHEEIVDIFKVLDRDGSGKICLEELGNFVD